MVLGIFILFNIASLIGFFAKDQTWTVYKHNPDWRSAGHYFAGELSAAKKKLFIFASTPADALKYYLLKNGCSLESQAKILYDYPGAKYEGISAEKIGEIYLVRNEYWRGDFQQLFDSTFRDQKFRFLSRRGFKGLTIYKFHILRDGAS
jgi:hypothetical protein